MHSLRGRLTLGVLVVLAVVLAAAGALASRYVVNSERDAFDDRLRRTAELSRATALAAVQEEIPGNDRRLDAVLTATRTSLRLLLGETVLLDTGAPPPRSRPLPLGLRTFSAGGDDYRAYVSELRDPNLGGLARLEIVSSLEALEERERELQQRLLVLGLLTLLAAGIGVWFTADRLLRPLARLRAFASRVAHQDDLAQRAPTDDGAKELRSLAESFNAMLARLGTSAADRERALDATRRFAADAGHELRTPLTSVQATLSALERHPELPPERRTEMARDALAEQRRMVDLLDGLQALARGDATGLERRDVDLADCVDGVLAAVRERHPGLEVGVTLPDEPVVVSGWEPGLRMLVENLVENAIRHGRDGGRVAVSLTTGPGGPVLRVDDDGPGIAAEDRERIFAPFARVEGTDRPGSGLGLALVAQQARHHDATVEVGEAPLGGARFEVRFAPPNP
ncbi:HAMP domain-containing histidine kinase [Svornostia abyssi]|uniref:histidine kinase n=1 Tax=Svornostia abyssi TaxID=2898438 RepID=A0ABY5PGI2_9ACTN|nr:HAMP domain-containing histidine kinase [Parviterribacteraceae bacterium J379]